jgi:hypothetical protein
VGRLAFFAFCYWFCSPFSDVWLNGDHLEVRDGSRLESVPLAAIREIEFFRYGRNGPFVRLYIALGAGSSRMIAFFPVDNTGFIRDDSKIVEELRGLVKSARDGRR